ncbi:hypothetical protein R1sor_015469 [Riccia sorocarpa]|uniref:Transposase n=1 Tax=Riccia sorocarpa TaxID=122646 RepID=A0ABD3HCB8_9MARC
MAAHTLTLMEASESDLAWAPHTIHTACILHNFLQRNDDVLEQRSTSSRNLRSRTRLRAEHASDYAETVREELASHLCLRN